MSSIFVLSQICSGIVTGFNTHGDQYYAQQRPVPAIQPAYTSIHTPNAPHTGHSTTSQLFENTSKKKNANRYQPQFLTQQPQEKNRKIQQLSLPIPQESEWPLYDDGKRKERGKLKKQRKNFAIDVQRGMDDLKIPLNYDDEKKERMNPLKVSTFHKYSYRQKQITLGDWITPELLNQIYSK